MTQLSLAEGEVSTNSKDTQVKREEERGWEGRGEERVGERRENPQMHITTIALCAD